GDLHARSAEGIASLERGRLGDDGTSIHDRIDATKNDIIDCGGIETVSVSKSIKHPRSQPHRRHFVQTAILLAATARCAYVIVNEGFRHHPSPCGPKARNLQSKSFGR